MTNYLPSTSYDVGNILYSPTSESHASQSNRGIKGSKSLDTVVSAAQIQAKQAAASLVRPTLPSPAPIVPADQLMIIAAAFCEAYSAMNQSVISGAQDLTKLQELDQTQAEMILKKTTDAINKQEALVKEQADLSAYQASAGKTESICSWTMFAAGIALVIGTAIFGIFTGGAADALIPEEMELMEMGEGADEIGADLSDIEIDDEPSDVDGGSHDLDGNSISDAQSESWGKYFSKLGLKLGFSAGLSSPLLVKGVFGLKIAARLQALSDSQKIVGNALAAVSSNNMYFQFLQQLMQREAGVTNEEVSDASEVIKVFTDLTEGIRGISYNLSQSA